MDRDYDFETMVSFRFLSLSEEKSKILKSLIPHAIVADHFKNKYKVANIDINDISVIEKIDNAFRELECSLEECDIFLSITTESDSEIWEIPEIVNSLLMKINCRMVFSFTSIDTGYN